MYTWYGNKMERSCSEQAMDVPMQMDVNMATFWTYPTTMLEHLKRPRVATSSNGQFVHVAWQDNTPGNDEIFYSRSTTEGNTWNGGTTANPVGPPINLSNTPRASNDHQLVAEGAKVYVVWVDYTTGNGDIYFKKSTNNGQPGSFSNSPTNLSRGSGFSFLSSRDPDMAAQGSLVSVIWTVYPSRTATGPGEIIFRESTN